MVGIVVRVIVNAIALWITSLIIVQFTFGRGDNPAVYLGVAVIFGLVNAFIRPILKLLTLPITLITLGLFGILINGGLLLLVAWLSGTLGIEFSIAGFPPDLSLDAVVWAIASAIVLGIVSALLGLLPLPGDKR
jgi:putative membrane protein